MFTLDRDRAGRVHIRLMGQKLTSEVKKQRAAVRKAQTAVDAAMEHIHRAWDNSAKSVDQHHAWCVVQALDLARAALDAMIEPLDGP